MTNVWTGIWIWDIEIFRRIIANISEGVWVCDKNEATIYTNNSFHKIVWYTDNEIKGKNASYFWDNESLKIINNNIKEKKQINFLKKEWTLLSKNWRIIPILSHE